VAPITVIISFIFLFFSFKVKNLNRIYAENILILSSLFFTFVTVELNFFAFILAITPLKGYLSSKIVLLMVYIICTITFYVLVGKVKYLEALDITPYMTAPYLMTASYLMTVMQILPLSI